MKRLASLLLFITAFAASAAAQGGLVSGITLDNRQTYAKVMSGANVAAYKCLTDPCPSTPGTLPAVPLSANQALTAPVTHTLYVLSDNNGNYNFWLPPATYLVCVSGTSFAIQCQPYLVGQGAQGGGAPYPPAGVPDSAGIGGPWLNSFTPQGTDTFVMTSDGTGNTNDCPKYDANGGLTDSGAPCGGTSSGTPGGANTSVQFNNSGAFGGFGTWDGSAFNIGTVGVAYSSRTLGVYYLEDDTFDSGAGSKTTTMTPGVFTSQQGASYASITNPFDILMVYSDSGIDPNFDNAHVEIKLDKFGQMNFTNSHGFFNGALITPNAGIFADNSSIVPSGNSYGFRSDNDTQGTPAAEYAFWGAVDNDQVTGGTDPALVGTNILITNHIASSTANKIGTSVVIAESGSGGENVVGHVWGNYVQVPIAERAAEYVGGVQFDSATYANLAPCDTAHDGNVYNIHDANSNAWGTTVSSGGGAVHAMLMCDGTSYRVMGSNGSGAAPTGVTSINSTTGGFTFTGGGVSCTGTTCTFSGAGTPAFPQTVSGTVNSGGVPYASSTTQLSISPTLTQYAVLFGGGAGAAPGLSSVDHTTTHALFATAGGPQFRAIAAGDIPTLNQSTTGNAGTATAAQSTPTICSAGQAPRGVDASFNATGCQSFSGGGVTSFNTLTGAIVLAAGTNVTLGTVGNTVTINATAGSGGSVNSVTASAPVASSGGANPNITVSVHGPESEVQTSDGTGAAGNCPQYKAGGGLTDSGAPCNSVNAPHQMYNVGLFTMNTGSGVTCTGSGPYSCTLAISTSFAITTASFCQANWFNTTAQAYTGITTTPGANSILFGFTGDLGGRVWFSCSQN